MRGQYAQVIRDNCTGCSLCYNDCPYEAITMIDRGNDGTRYKRLAVVDAGRCANCGLCVGACAFKAIEIPRRGTATVLEEIEAALMTSAS
jgi:formate hydrogenlyase subunit 6/NADH:ubiquinone oxidoreductase subunit I